MDNMILRYFFKVKGSMTAWEEIVPQKGAESSKRSSFGQLKVLKVVDEGPCFVVPPLFFL